jgi:septum formation protein
MPKTAAPPAPAPTHLPIVLASASPRRRELLGEAGVDFRVIVAQDAEPLRTPDEDCADFARRAAAAKAVAVACEHPGHLCLGADTIVVLDNEALGKPADEPDARRMIAALAGRTHQVMTGLALAWCTHGRELALVTDAITTDVTFLPLAKEQIAAYVATGEPLDKAGAYGIQGGGAALVAGYEGSYTNVVGLPMEAAKALLQAARAAGPDPDPDRVREAYTTAKRACMPQ